MVGGGQLARMSLAPAAALDVELVVLAERPEDPAVRAGAGYELGSPDDADALLRLAARADVVTFDHELAPPEDLRRMAGSGVSMQPPPAAQLHAQDKLVQRARLGELGLPVPAWSEVASASEVEAFAEPHGWPVVLKTARGGYDGRGVWMLDGPEEAAATVGDLIRDGTDSRVLVEERVEIDRELAVLVARNAEGDAVVYPVVETVQRDGICHEVHAPAPIDEREAREAQALGMAIAEELRTTGMLAVELFATPDGLVVNELAMRPHNSGHLTIEGCITSQFENHLRTVLGWPPGRPELVAPAAVMVNVLGPEDGSDPASRREAALAVPGAHVHLYGKASRPGRKLGHVTALGGDIEDALSVAREAATRLAGGSVPTDSR